MDERTKTLLNHIIKCFDDSYWVFLKNQQLLDSQVTRTAFFATAEQIVDRDPIPHPIVQREVLRYLRRSRDEAADGFSELIELTFIDAAKSGSEMLV